MGLQYKIEVRPAWLKSRLPSLHCAPITGTQPPRRGRFASSPRRTLNTQPQLTHTRTNTNTQTRRPRCTPVTSRRAAACACT
jgi:hypothetical protein